MTEQKSCPCPCHYMTGIFIILFGLNFLLKTLGVYSDAVSNIVWPIILILAGLKCTFQARCKCCSET